MQTGLVAFLLCDQEDIHGDGELVHEVKIEKPLEMDALSF
jgi:hypothetical protein